MAFTIKGFALYFAKAIMIRVAEEIKKISPITNGKISN